MKPLLMGMSDSLDLMAFKWKSIKPVSQRVWLFVIMAFALGLLMITAFAGSAFRILVTNPISGSEALQETLVLWINIFLANNASMAAGGVMWALIASIVLIPLVGYSFASIIPEGDLASIKVTDNHKISDSIFLQFVSTISFVQVMALTGITSIFTIGSPAPGLGIFFAWTIWATSVLATVLAAWSFEWLFRKYGIKSKLLIFAALAAIIGLLYLAFPDEFIGLFGVGEAFTLFVQQLSFTNLVPLFIALGIIATINIALLYCISRVASSTLKITERVKKTNRNKVLLARLGLANKSSVNNLSQFLANMILRQNNIWKPLALSSVFAIGMAVVFFAFYDVLFSVAALIPIMISLVWAINVFGIIGSGTTWLVSLPSGKKKLLGSVMVIQYIVITMIAVATIGLIFLFYGASINVFLGFVFATATASIVITQFSIHKAVFHPFRYRVHIRGESVLPPNKAFSYMIQLFIIGFLFSGMSYGVGSAAAILTGVQAWSPVASLGLTILVALIARMRFLALRRKWMRHGDILQNIIKTVGSN